MILPALQFIKHKTERRHVATLAAFALVDLATARAELSALRKAWE